MTAEGFARRIEAIEREANAGVRRGVLAEWCERMMEQCSLCVNCDFFGESRPQIDDPRIAAYMEYFDRRFSSNLELPGGQIARDFFA